MKITLRCLDADSKTSYVKNNQPTFKVKRKFEIVFERERERRRVRRSSLAGHGKLLAYTKNCNKKQKKNYQFKLLFS